MRTFYSTHKFCYKLVTCNIPLQVGSDKFKHHLQDTAILADHLAPLITELSRMHQALQEMSEAHKQSSSRIQGLEKKVTDLEIRNEELEKNVQASIANKISHENKSSEYEVVIGDLQGQIGGLQKHLQRVEKQNSQLAMQMKENMSSAVVPRNNDQIEVLTSIISERLLPVQQKVTTNENSCDLIREELSSTKALLTKTMRELENFQPQTVAIKQKSAYGGEVVPYEKAPSSELVKQVEDKVLEVERTLNVLSVHHSELELQLQASLASTHNGAFLWRIPEVRRRIRDAKIGRITSIYSPPFYTGRNGYKMCIRAYLNGDGTGEGTHLSIFFVLMRGEYDPLLQWPFEPKVSLILVDQDHKKHLVQTFKPNAQSSSFKRPVSDMNVASGCPEFAELSILDNPSYVKEDVMYIKAIVDTSKIFHP